MKKYCLTRVMFACCLAALIADSASSASAASRSKFDEPRLDRRACFTEVLDDLGAECYRAYVRENSDESDSRLINFPVAVFRGDDSRHPVPVAFLQGGPGGSIIDEDAELLESLIAAAGGATLIVFNERGNAFGDPELRCPGIQKTTSSFFNFGIVAKHDPRELDQVLPSQIRYMRDCHAKLEREGIDVEQYNYEAASKDLEFLRESLGYDSLALHSHSAGTGFALHYARAFPERASAIVLTAPWIGPLLNRSQTDLLHMVSQFLTDMVALCVREDEQCAEVLPDWLLAVDQARMALDREPVTASVDGSQIRIDGSELLVWLYSNFESEQVYPLLPRMLGAAIDGDHDALRRFIEPHLTAADDPEKANWLMGSNKAYMCGDMSGARLSDAYVRSLLTKEPALLGYEDMYSCAWWPSEPSVSPKANLPPNVDIPALVVVGQLDICCGWRWGNFIKHGMPETQLVEFEGVGHGLTRSGECYQSMVGAFLTNPKKQVDGSCAATAHTRIPWQLQ